MRQLPVDDDGCEDYPLFGQSKFDLIPVGDEAGD